MVRIEPATSADVADLLRLIRALAEYEGLQDEVVATEAQLTESLFGASAQAEALLARVDGQAVGMALYFHNYSTFLARRGLYLEDLFVAPEWRGRGIGKALLARVAGIAVTRDCGRLEWAVLDWNAPAIRFYQSLGARALSDWTVYRVTGAALQALADGSAATSPINMRA
jgi:GNAT superfamily N-acetyltransferase